MDLIFRSIDAWPEGWQDPARSRDGTPFKSTYPATLELLERELHAIDTITGTVQVDAQPGDFRRDGVVRAAAKITHPGVILTCDTKKLGVLVYSCDRFADSYVWRDSGNTKVPGWQSNLRAIALGLEALRRIERYGIADRGQQYAGWKALPAGGAEPEMTVDEAATFIVAWAAAADGRPMYDVDDVLGPWLDDAYKQAARRLHPDVADGSTAMFQRLIEARRVIMATNTTGGRTR